MPSLSRDPEPSGRCVAADLPAFSTRQSADAFARKRNGKVLTFTQVTPELIQSMNRNVHHRH